MKYPQSKIDAVLNHDCFDRTGYYCGSFKEFLAASLIELLQEADCFRPITDSGWEDIAGEALALLEPKIGKMDEEDGECFEVKDRKLYHQTIKWLVNYIFKTQIK